MQVAESKRICLVSTGLEGGGMERALTSLANFFAAQELQVVIVNLFKTGVFFELHETIQLVWPNLDRSKMHRMHYALRLLPYLRREICNCRPDAVLSFGEWINAFVILALAGTRHRLFISNRMGPQLKLGFPLDQTNRLLYRFATGIIAQTQVAKEIIQAGTGAKNIYVIPNAVRPIDVVPKSEKRIITVGRLSREKGHEVLLHSFAKMNGFEWMLDIVGDGPLRESLETKARELGIANRVLFHGHRKNFEELMANASIFVLPSFYEGFPNALVEAMSVPLACIASNCVAGPSEIITHGVDGLLFCPGNVDELASLLSKLTSDHEVRQELAQNAYAVRDRFAFDKLANTYLKTLLP